MAINWQNVPVIFGQGIDTKIDPKQQLLTTFRKARNVVYETVRSVKKRNGYDRIPLEMVTNQALSNASRLTSFKTELDVLADNKLLSFSSTTQKLASKGNLYPSQVQTTPIFNGSVSALNSDVAQLQTIDGYAYATSAGEVRYSLFDTLNNSFLASNNLVGTGTVTKCVAVNGFFYIFVANGTSLYYRRVNISAPDTLEPAVSVANNLDAAFPVFDIQESQGKIIVAYNSTVAGAFLRVVSVNGDGSLGSGFGVSGSPSCRAISVYIDSLSRVVVAYASTTSLFYLIANFMLSGLLLAATTIEAVADVRNVGLLETDTTTYKFWYEVGAASPTNHFIRQNTGTVSGTVGAPSLFIRALGLLAKPFTISGTIHIPCIFGAPIQSSSFLLSDTAAVISRFYSGVSSGLQIQGALPHSVQNSANVTIAARYATKTVIQDNTFFSSFGVSRATFSLGAKVQTATLGDNLHIGGGLLRAYDGDTVVEHGFHMFPDDLTAGAPGTGGSMSPGAYGYVALYRWTDNYGQEHRSAVSGTLNIILAGPNNTQAVSVPMLRVTEKTEVVVELYRTEDAGTEYYLTATVANNPLFDSVTIIDTRSDASLIEQLPLPTTGDVLDNGFAPAATVLATHTASNRLMAVAEDPNLLLYSKIRFPGQPVEWNESLSKVLDPIGGSVTAIASMDEKAIIFKQDAILFMSGSGPNNLGQQDNFTEPERVSIDVGCVDAQSVVLIPAGLMFKSRKGIYLLTRGLALDYVGAPVEGFNSQTITSAKIIGRLNQVRFTTENDECLVYNYFLNMWSTFDNHFALSAEVIENDYYYLRNSAEVFKENPTSFADNGSAINILIETGWMSFAQLQGFQRVSKMLVLGDWKSAHMLRVRAAYNFADAWVHEKVLNPVPDIVDGQTYGSQSPYGSGSPYGGSGNVYQARFDFEKQKCQAVKLQFQDLQSVPGEGLSLSVFTLEVGGKNGLFKPGQRQIKGLT